MPSPYIQGVRKINKEEVFPATPTIIKQLDIEPKIKEKWLQNRERFLLAKSNADYTYDRRLRPYQNEDVYYLTRFNKGKGVFNQQRVGKTPITLVTMKEKQQNRNIIIVPKTGIYQWKKEYKKWHGGELIELKDSWNKQKRVNAYQNQRGTLITNYDKVRVDLHEIVDSFGSFDAIVVDEAHMLRNYTGTGDNASSPSVVKAIMYMRKFATDAYALTGTPTPNKESDICGILAFLYPELFRFYWPTADYYFKIYEDKNFLLGTEYKTVGGFKNEYKKQEMLEFLETFSIQRKRKDVMKWIPSVDTEIIKLEPTKKQVLWYKELKEYFETEHVVCENVLTTMVAMRQIAHDPSVLDLKSKNPKFEWIKDHIKDYPDKPILIVGSFSKILKNLVLYLEDFKPRIMYGKTSPKKRQELIDDYQVGEYNILIANIQVAKEGITLSRAEEIIFLDPALTYTDNEQIQDRFLPTNPEEALNKDGQKIIHLILKKSIDIYIRRSLNQKKTATEIVNNYIKHLRKEVHDG